MGRPGKQLVTQQPERILVVDDSRDGADSLSVVLQMMGAECRAVYDGPSALALIKSFAPTTVLLDIGMPDMDGHEVARRIRADPELAGVRLIALTGWGAEGDRRRSQESGFDDHWVKPIEPDKLMSLVRSAEPGPG
jgi:CheY-like chemotaxis protein